MRRRAAAVVAVVALSIAPSALAEEAAPTAAGWWWFAQGAAPVPGLSLPPPPTVPPDGLYVASDAAQTEAIAALRYVLPEGSRPVTLTLDIADVEGVGQVGACPTSGGWQEVEAGPWSDRPSFDCSSAALGEVAADGATISFDVSRLPVTSALDVALVPLRDAAGTSPVLHLALEQPGPRSLSYEAPTDEQAAPTGVPTSDEASGAPPALEPSAAEERPMAPLVPALDAVPPPALSTPLDYAAAPRPQASPRPPSARLPASARPGVIDYAFGDTTRFRLIAALLAGNLGAAAAWAMSRPAHVPQLLTLRRRAPERTAALLTPAPLPVRGLGRFRRTREAPAPRL